MKPTVFLSHSSADAVHLARLKELLVHKTGGSIDFYLSSDGQSVPLGSNWVHSLEEALERSQLMFVFVSPRAISSGWLYFESGFCYGKKIRTVPLGYKGTDVGSLPAPLSLLQGFNLVSASSLENLIVLLNQTFQHQHQPSFSENEFADISGSQVSAALQGLGTHWFAVDQITVTPPVKELLKSPLEAFADMSAILLAAGIENQLRETEHGSTLTFPGVIANGSLGRISPVEFTFSADASIGNYVLDQLERVITPVMKHGLVGTNLRLDFNSDVNVLYGDHKISGRLLGVSNGSIFRDLRFRLGRLMQFNRTDLSHGPPYLNIELTKNELPRQQISDLIDILFERRVLSFYE